MSKLFGEYVIEVKFLLNFQVASLKKTAFFQFDPYLVLIFGKFGLFLQGSHHYFVESYQTKFGNSI